MTEEDLIDDIKFLKRKIDEPLNYVPGLFESGGLMRMRRGTDKIRLESLELELDILRIKTNDLPTT